MEVKEHDCAFDHKHMMWVMSMPFFQAQAEAIDAWYFNVSPKGEIVFEHPFIDASVTYSLFPAQVFFNSHESGDWQSMYLHGLGLEHIKAIRQEPLVTFGEAASEHLAMGDRLIAAVDYKLITMTDYRPDWCRDYFIEFKHDKKVYFLRVHFSRKEDTPATALDDMFDFLYRLEDVSAHPH